MSPWVKLPLMNKSKHPLRLWRGRKKVTLASLAYSLDVTPSHLSEIERYRNKPSLKLAVLLSLATGNEVTVGEFVAKPSADEAVA